MPPHAALHDPAPPGAGSDREGVAAAPDAEQPAPLAGLAAPPEAVPDEAPADTATFERVLDFLARYPSGPCFLALPSLSEAGEFRFEVFAAETGSLDAFRSALERETGALPNTTMKPVSPAQCRALDYAKAAPAYPGFRLYFELPDRDIASGARLAGRLGNSARQHVSLLVIDNTGLVQNLGTFLAFTRSGAEFAVPMTLTGTPVETLQLLVAIATAVPPAVLRDFTRGQADAVFSAVAEELRAAGATEDVAIVAFSLR